MSRISAVIITKNEEANLPRCLDSVKFVNELIIIDSDSTDRTIEIAESYGAKVYRPEWKGFGPAKQEGVDRASCEWILSIDADEEVPAELADEIQAIVNDERALNGYYMPRKTQFLGRWIKHCGWYPDYILRLFKKSTGRFDGAVVHEKVIVEGETGYLRHDLLHYSYPSLEQYLKKSNLYTTLGAKSAYDRGKRSRLFDTTIRPAASFVAHYVGRQGFLDGWAGFVLSVLSAVAVLNKYSKLRELERKEKDGQDN